MSVFLMAGFSFLIFDFGFFDCYKDKVFAVDLQKNPNGKMPEQILFQNYIHKFLGLRYGFQKFLSRKYSISKIESITTLDLVKIFL